MKKMLLSSISLFLMVLSSMASNKLSVIAHRGASGYAPEHTEAAKTLACRMKADYVEQDVVMTKDDQLVVLHDLYLDCISDVAERFPDRARKDGHYYVIDFTLQEIKSLSVTERFNIDESGNKNQVFPLRFPMWKSSFKVLTFNEEIELIQGLSKTLSHNIGIYPEIKAPAFHRNEGKDISIAVLKTLEKYGYKNKKDNVCLQCFDPNELQRIRNNLMPCMHMDLKLIQLIAYTDWNETIEYKKGKEIPYCYDWMFRSEGMKKIAEYADGIGVWIFMLVDEKSTKNTVIIKPLAKEAKKENLLVHAYTFRSDELPLFADSFDEMLRIFCHQIKVDGVFTDFPDKVVHFLNQ